MAKVSLRTVRVTEIPLHIERNEFESVAKRIASRAIDGRRWFSPLTPGEDNPAISFATQFNEHVGTITLPSGKHKTQTLDDANSQWRFDDRFNGVTVLSSPPDADLEYGSKCFESCR